MQDEQQAVDEIEQLVEDYRDGGLSRRELLQAIAGLTVAATLLDSQETHGTTYDAKEVLFERLINQRFKVTQTPGNPDTIELLDQTVWPDRYEHQKWLFESGVTTDSLIQFTELNRGAINKSHGGKAGSLTKGQKEKLASIVKDSKSGSLSGFGMFLDPTATWPPTGADKANPDHWHHKHYDLYGLVKAKIDWSVSHATVDSACMTLLLVKSKLRTAADKAKLDAIVYDKNFSKDLKAQLEQKGWEKVELTEKQVKKEVVDCYRAGGASTSGDTNHGGY